MITVNNQLLALTYIQAVADEDQEKIDAISETISPTELALATAKVAGVFAISVAQFMTPDGEPELHTALNKLRKVLIDE